MFNDINLLPKSRSIVSTKKFMVFCSIATVCLLLGAYVGVILPLSQKSRMQNEISELEAEIQSYSTAEAVYASVLENVNKYQQQNQVIGNIKDSYLKVTLLLDDLQRNVPGAIEFSNLTYSTQSVIITGTSSSYKEIAQYIVKLRSIDYFDGASLSFINSKSDDKNTLYEFNLTIKINNQRSTTEEGGQ